MALKITLRKLKKGDDGTHVDTYYAEERGWTFEIHVPKGQHPTTADVHFEFESTPTTQKGGGVTALIAKQVGEWQPIESAPKDSSWVLGLTQSGRQVVVRWGGGAWEDDNRLCRDPWYWMPLPLEVTTMIRRAYRQISGGQ